MPNAYTPLDWYWHVGGDTTRVYSSARGGYFPTDDSQFVAWQANALPSLIDSEASLGDTLVPFVGHGLNATSSVLVIQQKLRQRELDILLTEKVDNVNMVQGGNLQTISGTGVSNYQASTTNNYRSLRKNITDATTAQDVRNVDINAGWPANP